MEKHDMLFYFKWILGMSDKMLTLLVAQYRANNLCDACVRALEAVEALAND